MNQLEQRVKDRVAGREAAKPIVQLIQEEVAAISRCPYPAQILEVFHEELGKQLPQAPQPSQLTMNEAQAREFGKRPMPYGGNKGFAINTIPISYLLKLTETSEFIMELRAYLASPSVQAEQPDA